MFSVTGYYRNRAGASLRYGQIGFGPKDGSNWTGKYYVRWYECGVDIPGQLSVVQLALPTSALSKSVCVLRVVPRAKEAQSHLDDDDHDDGRVDDDDTVLPVLLMIIITTTKPVLL